jgi:hypothetical protein
MGVPFAQISVARAGALTLVSGAGLPREPGRELAARVLAAGPDGRVELAVAGGRLSARSDVPLEAGQTLALVAEGSRDEALVLRLVSVAAEARSEVPEAAPLPASIARVLAAAGAEVEGAPAPAQAPPAAQAPTAARAAEAGVRTPAQAAAFARLDAAGLPTTEAAVRGLAALVEDAPVGRALAAILAALGEGEGGESATWRQGAAPGGPSTPVAGSQPAVASGVAAGETPKWHPAPSIGTDPDGAVGHTPAAPSGAGPETPNWQSVRNPSRTDPGAPEWQGTSSPTGLDHGMSNWQPRSLSSATDPGRANWHNPPAPNAMTPEAANWQPLPTTNANATERSNAHTPPAPNGISPSGDPLADIASTLAKLVAKVADHAASGDPDAIRRAVATLGHGAEARLSEGRPPQEGVRGALLALAGHPAAEEALARTAERLADAIGAQALAAPSLPTAPPPGTPAAETGAYLQLPLPGGQTVEVRVDPDAAGGAGDATRPRRLAFLLHMSALGPVLVEATAGPAGVEATVKVVSDPARTFCADRAPDLASALEAVGAPRARVGVERMGGPAPTRLLPPPPASGLDVSA